MHSFKAIIGAAALAVAGASAEAAVVTYAYKFQTETLSFSSGVGRLGNPVQPAIVGSLQFRFDEAMTGPLDAFELSTDVGSGMVQAFVNGSPLLSDAFSYSLGFSSSPEFLMGGLLTGSLALQPNGTIMSGSLTTELNLSLTGRGVSKAGVIFIGPDVLGSFTFVYDGDEGIYSSSEGGTIALAAIPLPTTATLTALTLVGLFGVRRARV